MRDTTEGRVPRGTVWETDDVGVKVEVVVELEGALEATLARASGGEMQQELIPGGQPTVVWTGEEGGFKRLHGMQVLGAGKGFEMHGSLVRRDQRSTEVWPLISNVIGSLVSAVAMLEGKGVVKLG